MAETDDTSAPHPRAWAEVGGRAKPIAVPVPGMGTNPTMRTDGNNSLSAVTDLVKYKDLVEARENRIYKADQRMDLERWVRARVSRVLLLTRHIRVCIAPGWCSRVLLQYYRPRSPSIRMECALQAV